MIVSLKVCDWNVIDTNKAKDCWTVQTGDYIPYSLNSVLNKEKIL